MNGISIWLEYEFKNFVVVQLFDALSVQPSRLFIEQT